MEPIYQKGNVWLYHGDNVEFMRTVPESVVNLTVTSPPYDDLRKYTEESAWTFDKFKEVASELYRITSECGVVVWNVDNKVQKGSESLTSFKQAIFFVEVLGFKLHDTMIFHRERAPLNHKRYEQHFEYMFIFVKGSLTTFNGLTTKSIHGGKSRAAIRMRQSTTGDNLAAAHQTSTYKEDKLIGNIWSYGVGNNKSTNDAEAFKHPATFPEQLAEDHIRSWSNEGDLVFDPFMGSGTVAKMAKKLNRRVMGCEIAKEYVDIQIARLEKEV